MAGGRDDVKHQVDLGQVWEQSNANATQIHELRQDFNSAIIEIRRAIDRMGEKVNQASTPNFATMAIWAGVILTVIGMVFTPVAFFAIREYDRQDKMSEKLDEKLQREFGLTTQRTDAAIESLNKLSVERHNDAIDQIHRLQNELDGQLEFRDSQLRDDLMELRSRRYKDNGMLPPATKSP